MEGTEVDQANHRTSFLSKGPKDGTQAPDRWINQPEVVVFFSVKSQVLFP